MEREFMNVKLPMKGTKRIFIGQNRLENSWKDFDECWFLYKVIWDWHGDIYDGMICEKYMWPFGQVMQGMINGCK